VEHGRGFLIMSKNYGIPECSGTFDIRTSTIININHITSESEHWDANPPHGSVFAFIYRTLVPACIWVLSIGLLLRCKLYMTTRTAVLMSSMITHVFNVKRSNDDWSQTLFCGDLNLWSQSDDVFRGSVRLRKLLPLKCNGSEQLKSGTDVSKYVTYQLILYSL